MPTYDYQCRKCDYRFEAFHSIKADPYRDCPQCGSKGTLERLISAGNGLIFKGSGFYITDYKSKNGTTPSSTETGKPSEKSAKESKTKTKVDDSE